MRIISGHARGRKLLTPGNSNLIRPTADRAREALFSIIGNRISSALVLDLYAGTGALGLESLSRGASQVVFVEKHIKALELIRKNCDLCLKSMEPGAGKRAIIIKHDLTRGINLPPDKAFGVESFDLIFLDPPYQKGLAEKSLIDIDNSSLLKSNTLVIAEDCSGEKLPEAFSRLKLSDKRRYGETGFWFYTIIPSP